MTDLPSKRFLRCLMLYEFHKNNSASVATKNICDIYGDILNVRTCQHWFRRFRAGNYCLDDEQRSGRPSTVNDEVLLTEVESNPHLTIKELSERLQCPWSTVQEHLKKIGKVWREGAWQTYDPEEDIEMVKDVTKKVAKLNKVPHPKGRKTAQLTKKTIKAAGRDKVKLQNQMRINIIGEKIMWFKENLEPVQNYTPELTMKIIAKYLGRFDEELEQIQIKHSTGQRKGRQHGSREDIINMTIKNETNEYITCGIEMPDILNPKQLSLLRNWSGELRFLQNFKLVRYSKSKLENLKNSPKYINMEIREIKEEEKEEKEDSVEKDQMEID